MAQISVMGMNSGGTVLKTGDNCSKATWQAFNWQEKNIGYGMVERHQGVKWSGLVCHCEE